MAVTSAQQRKLTLMVSQASQWLAGFKPFLQCEMFSRLSVYQSSVFQAANGCLNCAATLAADRFWIAFVNAWTCTNTTVGVQAPQCLWTETSLVD